MWPDPMVGPFWPVPTLGALEGDADARACCEADALADGRRLVGRLARAVSRLASSPDGVGLPAVCYGESSRNFGEVAERLKAAVC